MKTPIWPYIAVVACLFVLSLLAPQAWLRPTLPPTSREDLAHKTDIPTLVPESTKALVRSSIGSLTNDPELNSPTFAGPSIVKQSDSVQGVAAVLQSASPAQVAPIHPPVGEQIKLDISVKETPALPRSPDQRLIVVEPKQSDDPVITPQESVGLQKQSTETIPEIAGVIPYAPSLIEGLEGLAEEPLCREWALEIISLLESVHQTTALSSPESAEQFRKLFRRLSETPQLAQQTESFDVRARLLRLGYAAKRRVDIWYQVHKILTRGSVEIAFSTSDMQQCLRAVDERLTQAEHANDWRKYLLLDAVQNMTGPGDPAQRREIAKKVLRRIESSQLSEQQVEVFQKSPFKEFSLQLRLWANEPIDYLKLLDQIEDYEQTGSTESAQAIARSHDVIRWSSEPEPRKLAEFLNTHFRNANVRVALTADFLNRLLPDPQSYQENVSGSIAGANVSGTSHTVNRLQVVLHPDNETWHIGLEAHGEVASDTAASKGPATFYNQGFSRYYARKLLMVDRRGVRVWRAETNANSESALTGFETDFDPIPILGWVARSVARSQHDQHYYSAKVETEEMVRNQAGARLDDEVHQRLAAAEQKVKQKLIGPFEKIDLKPTPLDMSTTEQRVIARYRLATDIQLGAQTPRPQAPGDSLLSVQVHESALNNTLANLKLEGRRTEVHKLYRELATIFERPELEVPDDIPEDMIIQFADKDAIRVRCDNSQVMLTIQIAELKNGRSKWKDFSVRAFYGPDSDQLNANLVREGEVQIIGDFVKLPLRVIFSKVLSKTRGFNLINRSLSENPRLNDCHVNQFVINDGWIGVGIGPNQGGELDQFANKKPTVEQR